MKKQEINFFGVMNNLLRVTEDVMVTLSTLSMVGFVFFQVIARICFGWSSPAIEEGARFLMIWSIFLGAVIASREDTHIRIECNYTGFFSIWLNFFSRLITFVFLCVFVFLSYDFLKKSVFSEMKSIVLDIPLSYVHACFITSGILMSIHSLESLCNVFINFSYGEENKGKKR